MLLLILVCTVSSLVYRCSQYGPEGMIGPMELVDLKDEDLVVAVTMPIVVVDDIDPTSIGDQ